MIPTARTGPRCSGSRGSAAMTYSRQPSSCREERIDSSLVSTNRSRSFGSTGNAPCKITLAMSIYKAMTPLGRLLETPICRSPRQPPTVKADNWGWLLRCELHIQALHPKAHRHRPGTCASLTQPPREGPFVNPLGCLLHPVESTAEPDCHIWAACPLEGAGHPNRKPSAIGTGVRQRVSRAFERVVCAGKAEP